jgi:hypothetical protein
MLVMATVVLTVLVSATLGDMMQIVPILYVS